MLTKLKEVGFRKVADWYLTNNKLKIVINIADDNKQVLYCLVVNDIPMYIGKSGKSLKVRMSQYSLGHVGQKTSKRIHDNLKSVLANDETVEVYTLYDQALLHYGAFHINLAAGLEDSIIYEISPKWNIHGINKTKSASI